MEARASGSQTMQATARAFVALLVRGSVAESIPESGHVFPFSFRATAVATYLEVVEYSVVSL
jgi:hypothetical protein